MREQILRSAAYWVQVKEIAKEGAVKRYAQLKYERYMNAVTSGR
ncbi:hypothetical protein [Paenibacillus oryzisoli]|nr:hypothetical protein [Paenibacillus oryzisoli]